MTDLVTTPRDKAFVSMLDITQYTGRAMFTTPDVPGERLEALRAAFDATMADPAFVAEMTRLAFDLRPQKGAELQAALERVIRERKPEIWRARQRLELVTSGSGRSASQPEPYFVLLRPCNCVEASLASVSRSAATHQCRPDC
jgi:hypothetical protein